MKDERRGEIEVKLRYFKDLYIHVYRGDFINFFFFFLLLAIVRWKLHVESSFVAVIFTVGRKLKNYFYTGMNETISHILFFFLFFFYRSNLDINEEIILQYTAHSKYRFVYNIVYFFFSSLALKFSKMR